MNELIDIRVITTLEQDIEDMKREATALLALLETPQLGLITWRTAVARRLDALNEIRQR